MATAYSTSLNCRWGVTKISSPPSGAYLYDNIDADIVSSDDDALSLFMDTDRKTIDDFFEFKPYMILYDYACRFVEITFLASDTNEAYTFLFWTSNAENSEGKFDDYNTFLAQHYVVESLDSYCIMYYGSSIQ